MTETGPQPPQGGSAGGFLYLLGIPPFILLHVSLIAAFFVPFAWWALALCGGAYLVRMFGITAGYHHYFSHRSYKTGRRFQFVLACVGCSALQRGPLWWAGHHSGHHRHSDTAEDLHSPHQTGFWWSHVGCALSPSHDATPHHDIEDFARCPEFRWLDDWHWGPGIAFAINSLSHLIGGRRYATHDESRNNWALALITLGEGWHNNNNHYQSSPHQGFFWYEVDVSYSALVVLGWLGVVWSIRAPGEKALNHRLNGPAAAPPVSPSPPPRSAADVRAETAETA
jgi:stearoyl-CoA desaturase (delta-9 desaturase)